MKNKKESNAECQVPEIHHSDQGMQYACGDYTDLLRQHGVRISMVAVGKPQDIG